MDTLTYWEKRNIEREAYWTKKSQETIERELSDQYAKSLAYIRTQIDALYGRFAAQNGLSIEDGRKLLTGGEYRVWRMEMEEYLDKIKGGDVGLTRELNTLAMRTRISRLEKLYGETVREIDRLGRVKIDKMDAFLTDAYKDNFYHQTYDLGKVGIALPTKMVDSLDLANVLRTPWSGKNYSQRIWADAEKLSRTIKDVIFNGVHRGISVDKMTKLVMERMDVSRSNAVRLVRTEMNYVNNRANLDSLEEAGMKQFRFVATLDKRTSAACQAHDGKIYDVKDKQQGVNAPPLHPHCRSIITAYVGEDLSKRTRIARDANGKNIYVPANMTYEDWKAVYIDKTQTLKEWKAANSPRVKNRATGGSNKRPLPTVDEYIKKDNQADLYYNNIRKNNEDIAVIAKNVVMSEMFIRRVKQHLFYNEHDLDDGRQRFYPDYNIAVAWQRLIDGEFEERDIILLRHEHLESSLEKRYNLKYSDAHELANKKYNWQSIIDELFGGGLEDASIGKTDKDTTE